jgi:heme/copper-type cytochrome/quinol oxidase subunit 3
MSSAGEARDDLLAEPAEVHERNLRIGVRVVAGSTIMFFLAFVFAYFYLRSLNSHGQWRPDGVDPPQGWGAAIVALFVLSTGSLSYAAHAARNRRAWLAGAGLSLALALAGFVAQGFEYAHLGFGPQSGGYASVFLGATIFFGVFVLFVIYWVQTLFAEGLRTGRGPEPKGGPPGLDELAFYWQLLAAIGVLTWVILYVI